MKALMMAAVLAGALSIGTGGSAQAESAGIRFASTPALSPDARLIAFSYGGDLWSVPASGGEARRLTAMEGEETCPRYSPDGRWIAFSASPQGNRDVYVMPAGGGEIRRLTHHDAEDTVESWSWDSRQIFFTSDRYNNFTGYSVDREGGTARRLFGHYFNTVNGIVPDPQTGALFFTDSWESYRYVTRKGYKGENNPDLKSYDPRRGDFRVHAAWEGKDLWPTVDSRGQVYFASDRGNGEYNLYRLRGDAAEALTSFPDSIKTPQVSADGSAVVFEKDYQIHLFHVDSGRSEAVPIRLNWDESLSREQDFNVSGKISAFAVAPDGKKLAFVSRGELFVSDIRGRFIRRLETTPASRVMEVQWLADSRTLLYNRTNAEGWLNLYTRAADAPRGAEKELTRGAANDRQIALNHAGTAVLYLSGRDQLKVLDLAGGASRTVVRDEFWGIDNSQPVFSPDDRRILFTAYRNFEQDVLLVDLASGRIDNLTDSGVSESSPCWSPDGRYVYFVCDRTTPAYPRGSERPRIYRLPLQKFASPFRLDEIDKLFSPAPAGNAKPSAPAPVPLDPDELSRRWEMMAPDAGSQDAPAVTELGEETVLLYLSTHDGNKSALWKTSWKPFEAARTQKIEGGECASLQLAAAGGKWYALVDGRIGELDLGAGKFTPLAMEFVFRRNLRDEFNQMFTELWAGMQENFYDERFHDVDWPAVRERYRRWLPDLRSRADLKVLITDMLGELNSSHQRFISRGDEEKTFHAQRTMASGLLFEDDRPCTVARVVKNSPVDRAGIDIRPGDLLTAVNGRPVDPAQDRDLYFSAPSLDTEMLLAFRRGETGFEVRIHPLSTAAFKECLYDDWIRDNRRRVDERGERRIAYLHMKDMGEAELNNFLVEMAGPAARREGLILDLRYNNGGNVHDAVLKFLSQRPYMSWKYRGGQLTRQPNFAPAVKPIVLLINEVSLSDAEFTAAGFRELKLGTIVGTETYRWLIFTSGKSLVDGSFYRLPAWGCYTLDGRDIEFTGVKPDIRVADTFKDRLEGRDPQLDAAVDHILKQLR